MKSSQVLGWIIEKKKYRDGNIYATLIMPRAILCVWYYDTVAAKVQTYFNFIEPEIRKQLGIVIHLVYVKQQYFPIPEHFKVSNDHNHTTLKEKLKA